MGNTCVTGACRGFNKAPPPPGGGSNQASDEAPSPAVQTIFKWRIDAFSSLLEKGGGKTYSSVFQMRGLYWYLKLNPRDKKSGDQNEYVSLQLELSEESVRPDTVVTSTLKLKFLIYDQSFGKHYEQQVTISRVQAQPLGPHALKENSSGFLVNNSCVFCVEFISVVIAKANDVLETLYVKKMKNTQVCTWNIEDFSALKNPSYSPEFELCGHKWTIKIYPAGDDTNGNYISLYLVMKVPDTLLEKSAILIEKTMCIKGQETGKVARGIGRSQYTKNSDCWGWEKFISLEDLKNPSNSYLVKTKCCIEVQVAVVGSSRKK